MKNLLDGLPAEDCPLPSSMDCNNDAFMVFRSETITSKDLESQADRNRARNARGEQACTRHGISVFPDLASCIHQQKLMPHLGDLIGSAKLEPDHGRIAKTPSQNNPSHMTWWPYKETIRHELFKIVKRD